MARAMLIESNTRRHFWPEAIATSAYLLNRLPTNSLDLQTPLEALSKHAQIPLPLNLQPRVFGCSVFVHIHKHERDKQSACANKCVFVGYGVNQKGYRCYDPKSDRIFTTMNCDFLESEYFHSQLSGQGESNNTLDDPLSRPPMPSLLEVDSHEKVIRTTEQASHEQLGPSSNTVQDSDLLIPTVNLPESESAVNDNT